jgi:hypothetical protein
MWGVVVKDIRTTRAHLYLRHERRPARVPASGGGRRPVAARGRDFVAELLLLGRYAAELSGLLDWNCLSQQSSLLLVTLGWASFRASTNEACTLKQGQRPEPGPISGGRGRGNLR